MPDFQRHFKIKSGHSILDVGCGKGFMLHDFNEAIPGLEVIGIDISEYAISKGHPPVKEYLNVGDARSLPFKDMSIDFTISITTLHNLERDDCIIALREIQRVTRKGAFITVDAYRNDKEKKTMEEWNLTALTVLHVDEWKDLFEEAGYTGDYYLFMP